MNCFNAGKTIRESIQTVLDQTYSAWTLFIWDNASLDNTPEVIKTFDDPRIRYFRSESHTSLGHARDRGYAQVEGDFLAVLDSDDLWMPSKLEDQMKAFADPKIGIVSSDILYLHPNGKRTKRFGHQKMPAGKVTADLLLSYFVSCPTICIRKNVLQKLDCVFDPLWDHISDFDLIVRASKLCDICFIEKPTAIYRVHPESKSQKNPNQTTQELIRWCRHNLLRTNWSWYERILIARLFFRESAKKYYLQARKIMDKRFL